MTCVSRRDYEDKNLFIQRKYSKDRWNLYTQIAIENNTLICANESYPLTEICHSLSGSQPCTLKNTNEIVDIGANPSK